LQKPNFPLDALLSKSRRNVKPQSKENRSSSNKGRFGFLSLTQFIRGDCGSNPWKTKFELQQSVSPEPATWHRGES